MTTTPAAPEITIASPLGDVVVTTRPNSEALYALPVAETQPGAALLWTAVAYDPTDDELVSDDFDDLTDTERALELNVRFAALRDAAAQAWADPAFRRAVLLYHARGGLAGRQGAADEAEEEYRRAQSYHETCAARVTAAELEVAALDPAFDEAHSRTARRLVASGFTGTPDELHATVAAILSR